MAKWLPTIRVRRSLWLAAVAVGVCAYPLLPAQGGAAPGRDRSREPNERMLSGRLPDKPSQPPAFTIPAQPLGFSAPNADYLGLRWSFASLDFLDEDHLLFTFRVPGLLHRVGRESDERQIRAVVLALPAGTVEAEALWTLHGPSRYLWMLKNGHFLLRDGDTLSEGDASLSLKPLFQFQGPLLWLGMDPALRFLVTNSHEPVAAEPKPSDVSEPANRPGDKALTPGFPATAAANIVVDGPEPPGVPDLVLRILRRDTGEVMLVSRVRTMVHLPINSDGYLESLRGNGEKWLLNLNFFSGGSRILGQFDSTCSPTYEFVSERVALVTACFGSDATGLVALSTDGRRLWEDRTSEEAVWPLVVRSLDGSRLARETLASTHAVNALAPLDSEDVRGQLVRVFDAANGKVAFEALASPALDAGGNVALSPSGRRVAVLYASTIQVFDLPAAPPLPAGSEQPSH